MICYLRTGLAECIGGEAGKPVAERRGNGCRNAIGFAIRPNVARTESLSQRRPVRASKRTPVLSSDNDPRLKWGEVRRNVTTQPNTIE